MTTSGSRPLVIALLLLAGAAPAPSDDLASAAEVGRIIAGPDFELLGLDGRRHHLADARGSVLLVNFWATWCASCRSEIPELNRLYADLGGRGVRIIGISTDVEGAEKVVPYAEEIGIEYPVLLDPRGVSTEIFGGLEGYPMTFIFDREGLIYSSYLGAQVEETLREDLEYLLQAQPSAAAPLVVDKSAE